MKFPCRVLKSCTWYDNNDQEARLVHEWSHYPGFDKERATAAVERLTELASTFNRGHGVYRPKTWRKQRTA